MTKKVNGNPDKLVPFNKMDPEKHKQISSKGGKRSAQVRRAKKELKETIEEILSMPLHKGQMKNFDGIKCIDEIKGKNISGQEALIYTMYNKALKGDVGAAVFLRDTMGELGMDAAKNGPIQIIDDIPKPDPEPEEGDSDGS